MRTILSARASVPVVLFVLAQCCTVHAAFDANSIVVLRLGDGSAAVTESAQSAFLDEYDMLTGSLVGSHSIPSAGSTALTLSGRGEHDGHLNLSSNGQYLVLGGYRADAGAANPVPQSPSVINRVIGRVDSNWNVDTSTALTDAYDQTDMTAVVSDNGLRFWTVGDGKYDNLNDAVNNFQTPTITGGLRYVSSLGASASVNLSHVQSITYDETGKVQGLWPDSIRSARIAEGQLYITTPAYESFVNRGAYRTEDPLPTAAADAPQTMIPVITNTEGSGPDPKGKFVPKSDVIFLDLDPSVLGVDTAYTTGGKDDYEKWSLVGDMWIKHSTQLLPSGQEINALDSYADGTTVTLFAATDQGIYRLVDTAGYNADFSSTFSMTPFIEAGSNTEFRGIAMLPEPASLILLSLSGLALLRRRAC